MGTGVESRKFEAEVQQLLDLMIHSLYSHREIFLRELISNASDALDRLRHEALTRPELQAAGDPFILLEVDPGLRVLRVVDDGIGMTREELVENLGTIARSGTKQFARALREQAAAAEGGDGGPGPVTIGQFGVGFYSSFMVADQITVETRRAGSEVGCAWRSEGAAEYTLEDFPDADPGTCVSLHLREEADGESFDEFLQPMRLVELVKKYSDFVEYPVVMDRRHFEGHDELETMTIEGDREVVVLNSRRPIWARPKADVTEEEYARFYQHLAHDWNAPLETIHFRAEGVTEYAALLYLPGQRPFDLFDADRERSHVSLYVRRVFVMANCEELMPPWLRFVRGVVDARDLPLNVSREILQQNRALHQIRDRLVKKVLDALARMLADDRERYAKFWTAFGAVLKEGLVVDAERRDALADLLLCATTAGDEPTTLAEYVERMPEGQEAVYCLRGTDRATAASSPHLEALRARGHEVLLFLDPVDEWVLQQLSTYRELPLRVVNEGTLELGSEASQSEREDREREFRPLLEALEARLGDHVESVRFGGRLAESPAVLVAPEGTPGPAMRRMMRETRGADVPEPRQILELNPDHALVARLRALAEEDPAHPRLQDLADLLLGQALLAEGAPLPDPARFARLVTALMVSADAGPSADADSPGAAGDGDASAEA